MNNVNKKIIVIYARDLNGVIACGGKLPWHIKSDLEFFYKTIKYRYIVCGKNTFKALPYKLKYNKIANKELIVMSNSELESFHSKGKHLQTVMEEAYDSQDKDIVMIGGPSLMSLGVYHFATDIYETVIQKEYAGDVYFSPILDNKFKLTTTISSTVCNKEDIEYKINFYKRKDYIK